MQRRDFMQLGGLALAGLALPPFGRAIAAEALPTTMDRGPVSLRRGCRFAPAPLPLLPPKPPMLPPPMPPPLEP